MLALIGLGRTRELVRSPAFIAALAGSLFLAAYAGGLIVRPGDRYLQVQSDVVYNLLPLAALCLVVVPVRRSRGRARLGWLCLAFLLATWLVGDSVFSYYDLTGGEVPFPGWPDLAYYLGYLGFIAALPLLTFPEQRLGDRRWLIDAAVVVVIAGTVMWEYLIEPLVDEGGTDAWTAAVSLGYPLLDLALLAVLVVTIYASRGRLSWLALMLAAASAFQVVADGLYTYVVTTTGYDPTGNPIELGWLAAYALIAVGFMLPPTAAGEATAVRPSLFGLVLPYAFGASLLVLVIASSVAGAPEIELIAGAAVAVALILARQFLTLRDNLALLVRAANFDELTGLPNRRRLVEDARRRAGGRRHAGRGSLVVFGLDDLKAVNDGLGRQAGDDVLRRAAEVLQEQFPEGERLARLEGDEFAVLLPTSDPQQAMAAAHDALEGLRRRPMIVSGHPMRITASAGIALADASGAIDELLGSADLALYEAKAAGGNRAHVYDPASEGQALSEARLMWKERINDALEQDRFVLYCQPIVDLGSGLTAGHEVLVRMIDEDGELQPPGAFLDVAERFGLIRELDRWVLRRSVRLLREHQRHGLRTKLSVNLSGKAFADADLLPYIRKELADSGADPSRLTLEVTETAAVADLDHAQRFVAGLRELGCEFAVDDFGVGFSSFSQLKHLPVDYIKIDGTFIRNLPNDEVDQHLVRAIVEMGRGLRRRTVAEFVEDEATVRLLREMGVDYGQGYHLGRPAPAAEVLRGAQPVARRAA